MTRIAIDAATRERLLSATEVVELVDENGCVVGTFKPADVSPYNPDLIPPISLYEVRVWAYRSRG